MSDQNTMGAKVAYTEDDRLLSASENVARVLGIVFIILGVGLIIFLIGGFIVSRLPYRVDPNLPIPTLDDTEEYTNKDSIDVTGTVLPGETVALYQNGERTDNTTETDEDGNFTFENITLEEEGEITFESAVTRGGIFKRRSEFSNEMISYVDWTPPSTTVSLEFNENSSTSDAVISGKVDPGATVIFEGETKTYEVNAGSDGTFKLEGVELSKGTNTYTVRIKDRSGNEVIASKTVEIAYVGASTGDINGNAVSDSTLDGKLPESAGELEAALEFLLGNKIMLGIGLVSIGVFSLSSMTALRRAKRSGKK